MMFSVKRGRDKQLRLGEPVVEDEAAWALGFRSFPSDAVGNNSTNVSVDICEAD